jgi:glycosyltransferase involved in cell wall biosynthesis
MDLFFSIIIPTYNRGYLIKQTIDSVLGQTYKHFEVLIVDDGSTDNTQEIIREYSDPRIHYFKKKNEERGAARNFGVSKAKGDYFTFLDSDDILYPHHFQTVYNTLKEYDFPSCYAQAYEIKDSETGKIIWKGHVSKSHTINQDILKGNFLSCFGVFLKPEVFSVVKFKEERQFAGTEDWLLWLQVAARFPFYHGNTITGALISHDNRSVLSFGHASLLFRTKFIMQQLWQDSAFIKTYGKNVMRQIYSHMLTYMSLHLVLNRHKAIALKYLLKAMRIKPSVMCEKRSMAIIKKVILG